MLIMGLANRQQPTNDTGYPTQHRYLHWCFFQTYFVLILVAIASCFLAVYNEHFHFYVCLKLQAIQRDYSIRKEQYSISSHFDSSKALRNCFKTSEPVTVNFVSRNIFDADHSTCCLLCLLYTSPSPRDA